MRAPEAARRIAGAAIAMLPAHERATAELPARIVAGDDLTAAEVDQARVVLASADGSPASTLACALMGGAPMRRAVTAAPTPEEAAGEPAPGPNAGVMVALIPDSDTAVGLAVPGGLPAGELHITLAYFGDAGGLDDQQRAAVVSSTAKAMEVLDGPLRLRFTHVAHLGPDDEPAAVAYEVLSPELHEFRRVLVSVLSIAGLDWSNRYAFRPHMTVTYEARDVAEAEWPEGPLDEPIEVEWSKVLCRFGPEAEDVLTVSSESTAQSSVTASAVPPGYPAVRDALGAVNASLRSLDEETGTEVRAAIDYGWRSALDRVGRMATRTATAEQQERYRAFPPGLVATAADLSAVNVDALIEPAVADTAAQVQRVVARAHGQVETVIGDGFGVDLENVFQHDPAAVATAVVDLMTGGLREVLGRLGDLDRIDPTNDVDPLVAPFGLVRDVLAIAGGADTGDQGPVRDSIGRPMQSATAGADSVAVGPGPIIAVRDSILAWADTSVTAGARRRAGGQISDGLRAELADVAARMAGASDKPPLEQVTVHTWRLNWNGRAIENLPRHQALAGTTVASESELASVAGAAADPNDWPGVSVSHPGDHRHCHCGWETRIELRPVQLALPV